MRKTGMFEVKLSILVSAVLVFASCSDDAIDRNKAGQTVHLDKPFMQDYSIKFFTADTSARLLKAFCDRNGYVQVLGDKGLLRPRGGEFLFPGTLVPDRQYRPVADMMITGLELHENQFVYGSPGALLSNAWAGRLWINHGINECRIIEGGNNFSFMVSDGRRVVFIRDSTVAWERDLRSVTDIVFDSGNNKFWVLAEGKLMRFDPEDRSLENVSTGQIITCIAILEKELIAGTDGGYIRLISNTGKEASGLISAMPVPSMTVINEIDGNLWFGSGKGAMMLRPDGRFNYYASERWLPSDSVIHISEGPGNSVLVLTDKGLGQICFKEMTLHDKAMFFEKQVRERHMRHGFNATLSSMRNGDVTTGSLEDSDNDGLWTSMYLASQAFRYSVTREDEALENVRESLDAMERLFSVNGIPGFPSRSFERRGYKYGDAPWRRASDPGWDWKSTTSSDEAIGHIFAYGVVADLIEEQSIRDRAVLLIDTLMSHILKNDLYLVDWDGKPTRWGRWNPEYVNSFPVSVGDRKLNSSNIIGMLQTAYHFTGKEKYRDAAFALMREHGYLENLARPMNVIGMAPDSSGELSRLLSETWNHSDDEMYYCGYWGLYNYAFNDTLKSIFREAIIDHWEAERPEREGLWNIMTSLTGISDFDLDEAVWYLQEYPLDLVEWDVSNSHRKDIVTRDPGFREQFTVEVLPPDELRIARHNANRFVPDGGGGGASEMSAGDIWLLPYWMGRYYKVIRAPMAPSGE
ncbi:MAG: hypothetical protein MUE32_07080 [Bacteroidales bacterium]|nr:hypothetical protein [Bacteroidales bacterium]